MLTLIAAVDQSMAIGSVFSLPWFDPEEQQIFATEFAGATIITTDHFLNNLPAGTFDTAQEVLVISEMKRLSLPRNHKLFPDTQSAMGYCSTFDRLRICAVGEQALYADLIEKAERIVLTVSSTPAPTTGLGIFPQHPDIAWRIVRNQIPDTSLFSLRKEMLRLN